MAKKKLSENQILQLLFEESDDEDYNVVNGLTLDNDIDDVENESEEEQPPVKRRKFFTKDRLVNSLESSLDVNNYDSVVPSPIEHNFTVVIEKRTTNNLGKTITWTNNYHRSSGRQSKENIIRTKCTPIGGSSGAASKIENWQLFFTESMIDHIVNCTNKCIDTKFSMIDVALLSKDQVRYMRYTCSQEMKAFIGLMYARGLLSMNHNSLHLLFKDKIGHPIFGATMSKHRFSFLLSNIKFDDLDTRAQRFTADRFSGFREVYEMFNNRCSSVLQTDEYLTIDETLYGCRNQVAFKVFNPSKPNKYGILFKSVNAVKFPFTFRTCVYAGKPTGTPGPYYVTGVMPTIKSLVEPLSQHVDLKGRNITMDRLYTSIELFE